MRRVHFALFVVLIALGSEFARGTTLGSVTGVVRDSAGTPQIGAAVQLLRPDLSILACVYTDNNGRFLISKVMPGRYALKAMGSSFLPSLRENLHIRTATVVNLTLNTLYEVVQWLPAQPRGGKAQKDDWDWTLRSAANRPLLRWLEDGPLVVVSESSGAKPKLKARLMATGREGSFGESGERYSATVEETPGNSRELLARVDFDPSTDAGLESMLGFRQDLGYAGAVQSVAAISLHPEVELANAEGLEEASVRSWETINLGDEFEAEAGSEQVIARFGQGGVNTVAATLPFATAGWRDGASTVRYRVATALPGPESSGDTQAATWLPKISAGNGQLTLEHGFHQELGWERLTDSSGVALTVYSDQIDHPAIEAMSRLADGDATASEALLDRSTGLLRVAGANYSAAGVLASADHRFANGNQLRLSYANGQALVLAPATNPASAARIVSAAHTRRTQSYSISLSGTLEGSGTRWQASYRWQPEATITPVATFNAHATDPYLNLHLRQPIPLSHNSCMKIEALLDIRNLLAEGYQPYLTSDGAMLIFAQDQRNIGGGFAFTF
jgi:hypothetical protein